MINLKKVTIACILGLGISAMGSGILPSDYSLIPIAQASDTYTIQIGRASCRERV